MSLLDPNSRHYEISWIDGGLFPNKKEIDFFGYSFESYP